MSHAALDQVVAPPPPVLVTPLDESLPPDAKTAVRRHVADPKHLARASPVFITGLAIIAAARPDGGTVGIAADVLDVGIRSRDPAVPHDVALPHRVLRLVHPITIVLGHCGVSFRATCRKGCTAGTDRSGGHV